MASANWLRALKNRCYGRRSCSTVRKQTARTRLSIEQFERRILLTTQVFNVTTTADEVSHDGLMSLREAIIQANAVPASDEVRINLQTSATYSIQRPTATFINGGYLGTEGTFYDPSYGDLDITRSMVIEGNGDGIRGEWLGRIFQISGGANVTINNLSILTGGGSLISRGAGIFISGGSNVTLNNVRVFSNRTEYTNFAQGGGLYADNSGGTITINGGEFSTNAVHALPGATARGGAIYLKGGQLNINGTFIALNSASGLDGSPGGEGGSAYGGALYVEEGSVSVSGVTFDTNWTQAGRGGLASQGGKGGIASGGAIYVQQSSSFGILNSTFTGNRADSGFGGQGSDGGGDSGFASGGAIRLGLGSVSMTINGSKFVDNRAFADSGGPGNSVGGKGGDAEGGAIAADPALDFLHTQQNLTIRNSHFENNLARGGSGGYAQNGSAGLGGNAQGGAIHVHAATSGSATLTIENSPFLGNRAMAGDGGDVLTGPAGRGGAGSGGAIAVSGPVSSTITGTLDYTGEASNPTTVTVLGLMAGNQALGGRGGEKSFILSRVWSSSDAAGHGGNSDGGAVAASGGSLQIRNLAFADNGAYAGNGGNGDPGPTVPQLIGTAGGDSGRAFGGALSTSVATTLEDVTFVRNAAAGGRLDQTNSRYGDVQNSGPLSGGSGGRDRNGVGLRGGAGGSAFGGAVHAFINSLTVRNGSFMGNQAIAGVGGPGAVGADVHGSGQGGSSPVIDWESNGPQAGGSGGAGGDAYGGAIEVMSASSVSLSHSLFAGNAVLAGRGGTGGRAGTFLYPGSDDQGGGASGGDGGRGGSAFGGAVAVAPATPGMFPTTVSISDSVVGRNVLVAGDGGFGGNGGGGIPNGGRGGSGGDGGAAHGGGVYLDHVTSTIARTTVEENTASAGWGGSGGYGGIGAAIGGAGGSGGDGGAAAGGAIALMRGSLNLHHSTVVSNRLFAGPGGLGGFGGRGVVQEGGNGGPGGDGGKAMGGGVYIAPAATANSFVATADTVALNTLQAGFAGFGGAPGDGTSTDLPPSRYQATAGRDIAIGAMAPLPTSVFSDALSTGTVPAGFGSGNSVVQAFDTARYYIGGAVVLGAATSAIAGVVGLGVAAGVASTTIGSLTLVGGISFTTVASPALVFVAIAVGGFVAAMGGVFLTTELIAEGIATGDWEGAARHVLGDLGGVSFTYSLATLFGAGSDYSDEDDYDPPPQPPPGVQGPDGAHGVAEGSNLWGSGILSLSRTIAAKGSATERRWARAERSVEEKVDPDCDFVCLTITKERYYEISETTSDVAVEDIRGPFSSDGSNLIGAVNSGYASDLHGTTAAPLDPRFDSQTRLNGGTTPTLKLLPGSPGRWGATIPSAFTDTSQNDYVWSGRIPDIGAWGAPANRAPLPVPDARNVPQNGSIMLTVGSLLANDTDADGDKLQIVGGASAFTSQHGTTTVYGDPNDPHTLLRYVPDAGYLGTDVVTYQVTDGQFNVASKIDLAVLAAEFSGLSDHTIPYGTPQLNLTGSVVVGGVPIQSFPGIAHVRVSFPGFSGTFDVNENGHFIAQFFPGFNLKPSTSPYTVTYEYFDQGTLAASGTSQITVEMAPVNIHWNNSADITYGTLLSAAQLNAIAAVSATSSGSGDRPIDGTYVYTPPSGVLLSAGDGQVITLVFTPAEPEYAVTTDQVIINVNQATPTLAVAGLIVDFDAQPHPAIVSLTGALNEGLTRYLTTTYTDSTGSVSTDPPVSPGSYRVSVSYAGNANYEPVSDDSQFIVIRSGPPVAAPGSGSTDEDTVIEFDLRTVVTDPDTPVESLFFDVFSPTFGTVELLADGHTARFLPATNYNGNGAGFSYAVTAPADDFGPEVTVGPQFVQLQVAAVNDAPVNALPGPQTVDEDNVLSIFGLNASDVDLAENTNTMKVTLSVEHGTLSLAQTGGLTFDVGDGTDDATVTFSGSEAAIDAALAELVYKPAANFNGAEHLHMFAEDMGNFGASGPLTDSDMLDILVNSVNDAPVAVSDNYSTPGDTPLTITAPGLLKNDSDVDGDALVVGSLTQAASGILSLNADGSFTYTPNLNFYGTDSFSYTASDGHGGTASTTVTIDVARVAGSVGTGSTAGIGFWASNNGQGLILAMNASATSKTLGNWLATNFPNLYGKKTGANNLSGATNTQIVSYVMALFNDVNKRLESQVIGAALANYVTRTSLNSTTAGQSLARGYGFIVNASGTGALTFNVGNCGSAFGVPDGTRLTVLDMLRRTNDRAVNGVLWNSDVTLRQWAIQAFGSLNVIGSIH
jgi:hypothetical protein